jgi:hypothetical protein
MPHNVECTHPEVVDQGNGWARCSACGDVSFPTTNETAGILECCGSAGEHASWCSGRVIKLDCGTADRLAIAERLRQVAAEVEAGRVTNVALAVVLSEGRGVATYFGLVQGHEQLWQLVGATSLVQHRLHTEGDHDAS